MEAASLTLNILAAVCLLAFWYGYALALPFKRLPEGIRHLAVHPRWPLINLLGLAGTVFASAGLIVISWNTELNTLGSVGVLLAVAGLQLLGGNLAWESMIWPVLAKTHPTVLSFDGPLYSNGLLLGYFALAGLIFSSGYVLLALSLRDTTPIWIVFGLGCGAPLFAAGPLFGRYQVLIRSVGITLLTVAQAALGAL
jgi:hypothetical protein